MEGIEPSSSTWQADIITSIRHPHNIIYQKSNPIINPIKRPKNKQKVLLKLEAGPLTFGTAPNCSCFLRIDSSRFGRVVGSGTSLCGATIFRLLLKFQKIKSWIFYFDKIFHLKKSGIRIYIIPVS